MTHEAFILILSSWIIFTITALNSFSVDCLTPLNLVLLLGFYLVPLLPHFVLDAICIFMYVVGKLCFLTLEK